MRFRSFNPCYFIASNFFDISIGVGGDLTILKRKKEQPKRLQYDRVDIPLKLLT